MSTNKYILLKAPFMKEFKKLNKRQFKKFLKKEAQKKWGEKL